MGVQRSADRQDDAETVTPDELSADRFCSWHQLEPPGQTCGAGSAAISINVVGQLLEGGLGDADFGHSL